MRRRVLSLALVVALGTPAHAARLTVCAFGFHAPYELQAFREHLPADDFDVMDLSPHLPTAETPPPADAHAGTAPWLYDLCRPELRCDVAVFSGEFAGTFFGSYGTALSLTDMQEASCDPRCDGLFHAPREVFLLGCNTLATKDQDTRTPAQYLDVLLAHGFDQPTAERVVAARYGPLGPSFRESIRRVFADVPRLYGFSSVAPAGEHTAPLLARYFRAQGDYRAYLARTGRSAQRNATLATAFRGTGLVQSTGLARTEPAAADRERVCRLYDERTPVAERLRIVAGLMQRPDFLAFLPTIQTFLDRHPPARMAGDERRLFDEARDVDAARAELLRVVDELDVSALRLQLAHVARDFGWMSDDDFRALAVDGARRLLGRPLTTEAVDVVCDITKHEPLHDQFGSDDLPARVFQLAEGIRLVDCLAPRDPRVTARLIPALDLPELSGRLWAAYALSRRPALDEATLAAVGRRLEGAPPELRERLQDVLAAGAAQRRR